MDTACDEHTIRCPETLTLEHPMSHPTCSHTPTCPSAESPDRDGARIVSSHPEQGWYLLCNQVVLFDDTGELLPDGRIVAPHRPAVRLVTRAA